MTTNSTSGQLIYDELINLINKAENYNILFNNFKENFNNNNASNKLIKWYILIHAFANSATSINNIIRDTQFINSLSNINDQPTIKNLIENWFKSHSSLSSSSVDLISHYNIFRNQYLGFVQQKNLTATLVFLTLTTYVSVLLRSSREYNKIENFTQNEADDKINLQKYQAQFRKTVQENGLGVFQGGGSSAGGDSGDLCDKFKPLEFKKGNKNCDFWFSTLIGSEEYVSKLNRSIFIPLTFKNTRSSKAFLLYGFPGTGKTALVKAAVNEYTRTLNNQDSSTTYKMFFFAPTAATFKGKYVGETEKNIEAAFRCMSNYAKSWEKEEEKKNRKAISIMFIDEIDSLLPSRLTTTDKNDANVVNTFLQQMDGIDSADNVMLIGATNYPWTLDGAILSRFSNKQLIKLPTQEQIVRLLDAEMNKLISFIYEKKESGKNMNNELCEPPSPIILNWRVLKERYNLFPNINDGQISNSALHLFQNFQSNRNISNIFNVLTSIGTDESLKNDVFLQYDINLYGNNDNNDVSKSFILSSLSLKKNYWFTMLTKSESNQFKFLDANINDDSLNYKQQAITENIFTNNKYRYDIIYNNERYLNITNMFNEKDTNTNENIIMEYYAKIYRPLKDNQNDMRKLYGVQQLIEVIISAKPSFYNIFNQQLQPDANTEYLINNIDKSRATDVLDTIPTKYNKYNDYNYIKTSIISIMNAIENVVIKEKLNEILRNIDSYILNLYSAKIIKVEKKINKDKNLESIQSLRNFVNNKELPWDLKFNTFTFKEFLSLLKIINNNELNMFKKIYDDSLLLSETKYYIMNYNELNDDSAIPTNISEDINNISYDESFIKSNPEKIRNSYNLNINGSELVSISNAKMSDEQKKKNIYEIWNMEIYEKNPDSFQYKNYETGKTDGDFTTFYDKVKNMYEIS